MGKILIDSPKLLKNKILFNRNKTAVMEIFFSISRNAV